MQLYGNVPLIEPLKYKEVKAIKEFIITILSGKAAEDIKSRARTEKFDERLALLRLLLDAITDELRNVNLTENRRTDK